MDVETMTAARRARRLGGSMWNSRTAPRAAVTPRPRVPTAVIAGGVK
jgi:hypothetical protein